MMAEVMPDGPEGRRMSLGFSRGKRLTKDAQYKHVYASKMKKVGSCLVVFSAMREVTRREDTNGTTGKSASERTNERASRGARAREFEPPADAWRLGLAVSRKVGSAVVRGRCKRLIREAFRHLQHVLPLVGGAYGLDVIVSVRSAEGMTLDAVSTEFAKLAAASAEAWERRRRDERGMARAEAKGAEGSKREGLSSEPTP